MCLNLWLGHHMDYSFRIFTNTNVLLHPFSNHLPWSETPNTICNFCPRLRKIHTQRLNHLVPGRYLGFLSLYFKMIIWIFIFSESSCRTSLELLLVIHKLRLYFYSLQPCFLNSPSLVDYCYHLMTSDQFDSKIIGTFALENQSWESMVLQYLRITGYQGRHWMALTGHSFLFFTLQ